MFFEFFFFFSSRRRHTRFDCDWSSDVCSSDLFNQAFASTTGQDTAVSPYPPQPLATRLKRSEEHTSELQSQSNLVCRLLLEKKKKIRHASTVRVKIDFHRFSVPSSASHEILCT